MMGPKISVYEEILIMIPKLLLLPLLIWSTGSSIGYVYMKHLFEEQVQFLRCKSPLKKRKNLQPVVKRYYQSYTFPYENPPFLGSQKFDFIGLIITILAAKPQVKQHT